MQYAVFIKTLLNEFSVNNQIVGLLDYDDLRFTTCKKEYPQLDNVPTYGPEQFQH